MDAQLLTGLEWGEATMCNGNDEYVVIPEGTTIIAEDAFRGKPILSVQIPDSVQVIGARAFAETALEEIILPRSLKFLQCKTFYNCKKLHRVVLPEGLIGIGKDVFECCSELKELTVPDSVRYLYGSYFEDEESVTEYSFEKTYGRSSIGNLPATAERLKALYDTVSVAIPEAATNKLDFGRFTFYYERVGRRGPRLPSIAETLELGEEETVLRDVKGQNHLRSIINIPTFDEDDRMYCSYTKMLLLREPGKEGLTAVVETGGYVISSIKVYKNVYPGNGKTKYFLDVMGIY